MSNKGLVLKENITNIANTIRNNLGISNTYKPRELALAVQNTIDKYKNNNPTSTVTNGILTNALDVPVKNYKVFGNSEQNTTTGKNLFNILSSKTPGTSQTSNGITFTYNSDGTITANGTNTSGTQSHVEFTLPTDYAILGTDKKIVMTLEGGSITGGFAFSLRDNSYGNGKTTERGSLGTATTVLTNEITYNRPRFYTYQNTTLNNVTIKIMVVDKNITDYTYEPYTGGQASPNPDYPQPIYSVGDLVTEGEYTGKYKVPVKISGKNRWTRGDIDMAGGGWGSRTYDYILPAGTYTFSCETFTSNDSVVMRGYYDQTTYVEMARWSSDNKTKTFIATNDIIKIEEIWNNRPAKVTNIQLEESTTATDFEPYHEPITTNIYLDEPLRGIGTVKDYIEFATQKRHNLIGRTVLNGSESITGIVSGEYLTTYQNITNLKSTSSTSEIANILSNYFSSISRDDWYYSGVKKEGVGVSTTGLLIFKILASRLSAVTSEGFKTWLTSHNTEVLYELATPTEENITLPQLNLFEGTNIIEIGTETQATTEVVYITSIERRNI